jgi:predicted transcriptional regulator
LSKPELEFLKDNCNFTDDEILMLNMASKRCSDIQIADKLNISTSTVTKRKRALSAKVKDFLEVIDEVTTIYVNGKQVTKDEVKQYEIHLESVKKILSEKLTKSKK